MKHPKKPDRPTVKVKPRSYQPTKAELREELHIPTTLEHLTRLVTKTVTVQESEDPE